LYIILDNTLLYKILLYWNIFNKLRIILLSNKKNKKLFYSYRLIMAFPSVNVNNPDPFFVLPLPNQFPLSKVAHLPASQYLSSAATLLASQLTAPLVIEVASPSAFPLPASASQVYSVLGGSVDANGLVLADTKVQAGDLFVVNVYNCGAGAATVGGVVIAAGTSAAIVLRWTTVTVGLAPVYSVLGAAL
jgi:hypothetical protein